VLESGIFKSNSCAACASKKFYRLRIL
jgi:hypothetical protein